MHGLLGAGLGCSACCRQKCPHLRAPWSGTGHGGHRAQLLGSQDDSLPCPAAPEGQAEAAPVRRVCKQWKAEERRAKPGTVLISWNSHACPRFLPACFPSSKWLVQTRKPTVGSLFSKDLRAVGLSSPPGGLGLKPWQQHQER